MEGKKKIPMCLKGPVRIRQEEKGKKISGSGNGSCSRVKENVLSTKQDRNLQ